MVTTLNLSRVALVTCSHTIQARTKHPPRENDMLPYTNLLLGELLSHLDVIEDGARLPIDLRVLAGVPCICDATSHRNPQKVGEQQMTRLVADDLLAVVGVHGSIDALGVRSFESDLIHHDHCDRKRNESQQGVHTELRAEHQLYGAQSQSGQSPVSGPLLGRQRRHTQTGDLLQFRRRHLAHLTRVVLVNAIVSTQQVLPLQATVQEHAAIDALRSTSTLKARD